MFQRGILIVVLLASTLAVTVANVQGEPLHLHKRQATAPVPNPVNPLSQLSHLEEVYRRLTGKSLDQTLSAASGHNVNLRDLVREATNDSTIGDPWQKVAEKIFGSQAVAKARSDLDRMRALYSSPQGREDLINRVRQMMQSRGLPLPSNQPATNGTGVAAGQLPAYFNQIFQNLLGTTNSQSAV